MTGAVETAAIDSDGGAQATPDSGPIARGKRIDSLDFIRGIAVMGILAANIVAFGQPMTAYMYPGAFTTGHSPAEDWMWIAQFVLIDGKMRTLFTLLFGAGMYLFMERAWARGEGAGLQVRRLLWLLLFGMAHFFLLWRGDILTFYAGFGLLALPMVYFSARVQFVVGLLLYAMGALLWAGLMGIFVLAADTPTGDPGQPLGDMREQILHDQEVELEDGRLETELISEGRYGEWVAHNLTRHRYDQGFMLLIWFLETFPLLLIGMALYRWGFFEGRFNERRMRRWGWIGLALGGLVSLLLALWVRDGGYTYYGTQSAMVGFTFLPRLAMALGMAALFVLMAPRATGWLGSRIKAAGRAAFTNYLGTSMLMVLVFHGWAAGLFGELGRTQLYLVVLLTWAIMLLWSKPWLERFRFGPLEWLWRCLTYGRRFALRR